MALTDSTKLYSPEVWEDMAQAEFTGKVVVANAALSDDTLVGNPGNTVDFPKWDALGELDDLTEGVAMTTEALTQSATKATIREAGKAVEITDNAMLTGLGDPQGEAIRQFGVLAARKVDADLIAAATATVSNGVTRPDGSIVGDSAPLANTLTTGNTVLTWDHIVDSIAQFGDDFDLADVWGMFVRSDAISALHKDDQFISASQVQSGNNIVLRGFLGQIGGMPVYVTDRLAARTSLIVKRNSLGVLWKRRPIVEQDRDILKRSNVVTTNLHYAVKRLNDKGVVVITTSAS
ncbi:N4-gp56 family major capsid protein [Salinispora cortesiana]|uniref:N4-gp56 family major capsid protein n=1 Tax=Salinispora cortesiana TaxID=1305843 RepID=UPI0003FE7D1C|nr:N4-gp56 family major capsid protein [Salinispora cortesiana]